MRVCQNVFLSHAEVCGSTRYVQLSAEENPDILSFLCHAKTCVFINACVIDAPCIVPCRDTCSNLYVHDWDSFS